VLGGAGGALTPEQGAELLRGELALTSAAARRLRRPEDETLMST